MANENKKITLVERAFALPDSEKEFGMKIADHKLICNVLDDHMDSVEGMIDQKILKTLQSDELTDKIADKVYDKLAEYNKPILEKLGNLIDGLSVISNDISEIKDRLTVTERRVGTEETRIEDHEKRLNKKKKDIQDLRDGYEKNKEHLEYVASVKPALQTLQNMFNFWRLKNWWKIVFLVIGVLALFVSMLIGVVFYMHKKGWVTYEIPQKTGMQQIQADIKTGNVSPITRSIHYNKLTDLQIDTLKYTKEQQDSIKDAGITARQEGIMKYNIKPYKISRQ